MKTPRALCLAAALAASTLWAAPADAELLQLYAEVHGGGAGGAGLGGARADDAFHAGASGVTYGAIVGAEVLFIDGWIQHNQYLDGDGLVGTWTQFMLGLDLEIDMGAPTRGVRVGDDGKPRGGYSPLYSELGIGIGFGVGTGQQVEPPLNNAQVTDKGFVAQAKIGFGYRLSRMLSIGVSIPVQAGYMFKSGPGIVANDEDTHYQSVQMAALLNLRMALTIK